MKNRAIFLDRDGTIIYERNYLSKLSDIKLLPGVKNGLKLLKSAGFLLIVITNQSGIARGFFDRGFVESAHLLINKKLGGIIDDFFICPHLPNAHCACRKPKNGMIRLAVNRWKIEPASSWIIGDKNSDIKLKRNSRMKAILIGKNRAYYSLGSWNQITKIILKNSRYQEIEC